VSKDSNRQTILELYDALKRRDGKTMGQKYHQDACFKDPVFGQLSSTEVGHMWCLLCQRGEDLEMNLVSAEADDKEGEAVWEARYSFGPKGHVVHNRVHSRFVFRDGLIVDQVDDFDMRRWMKMALGTPGRLLGWAGFMRSGVQKKARRSLESFARRQSG